MKFIWVVIYFTNLDIALDRFCSSDWHVFVKRLISSMDILFIEKIKKSSEFALKLLTILEKPLEADCCQGHGDRLGSSVRFLLAHQPTSTCLSYLFDIGLINFCNYFVHLECFAPSLFCMTKLKQHQHIFGLPNLGGLVWVACIVYIVNLSGVGICSLSGVGICSLGISVFLPCVLYSWRCAYTQCTCL